MGTIEIGRDVLSGWDSSAPFIPSRAKGTGMTELETESQQTRAETATLLRDLGDQLEAGGVVTVGLGDRRVSLDPTEPITVKLEGESDWQPGDTEAKQSIEIELVWRRPAETAAEGTLDVGPA